MSGPVWSGSVPARRGLVPKPRLWRPRKGDLCAKDFVILVEVNSLIVVIATFFGFPSVQVLVIARTLQPIGFSRQYIIGSGVRKQGKVVEENMEPRKHAMTQLRRLSQVSLYAYHKSTLQPLCFSLLIDLVNSHC